MIRRPPRSTLFPYTRSSDLCRFGNGPIPLYRLRATKNRILDQRGNYWDYDQLYLRSEEHTSELQSHLNLVCRLLLEKKKNNYLYQSENHTIITLNNRSYTQR